MGFENNERYSEEVERFDVKSLDQAVAVTKEKYYDSDFEPFLLVDIDGTLTKGFGGTLNRFPLVNRLVMSQLKGRLDSPDDKLEIFEKESMRLLQELYFSFDEKVCIATNRTDENFLWGSKAVMENFDSRKKAFDMGQLEVFLTLDRLIPLIKKDSNSRILKIPVVRRWMETHERRYEEVARWVLSKRTKTERPLMLVMISDKDILGLSFYEGNFLKGVKEKIHDFDSSVKTKMGHVRIVRDLKD